MIGVISRPSDDAVVREFFELFKTPWEMYRRDGEYEVLLYCADGEVPEKRARLTVIYASRPTSYDLQQNIKVASPGKDARLLTFNGMRMPIYGESITFHDAAHDSAMFLRQAAGKTVARFGYDLFDEVRSLLTTGQPAVHAGIPALDLHIGALRNVIVGSGAHVVEIPPVPLGYRFVACLTHDVDHPLLRRHKFDHTMFGFLWRATFGSLARLLGGRLSLHGLLRNGAAALRLPLVHLGLAKDFWRCFDRYVELERGAPSTFFVIPFAGCAGQNAPHLRASRYGAADISNELRGLLSSGCEIGLHGIDAWRDASEGRRESEAIQEAVGRRTAGARMHWLYYDDQESPLNLERVGFDYDSTVGYNETIGYRAGTTQVYKPLQATRLLELPLHIMDTALFYPSYLDLSPKEARDLVGAIIGNAVKLGGCVTVNWHDRSIAPERLWGDFYSDLTGDLSNRGAWFATATQAVAWFRKRRAARFETARESSEVRVKIDPAETAFANLPGLQLRMYNHAEACHSVAVDAAV